jgi:hypothetical protein
MDSSLEQSHTLMMMMMIENHTAPARSSKDTRDFYRVLGYWNAYSRSMTSCTQSTIHKGADVATFKLSYNFLQQHCHMKRSFSSIPSVLVFFSSLVGISLVPSFSPSAAAIIKELLLQRARGAATPTRRHHLLENPRMSPEAEEEKE